MAMSNDRWGYCVCGREMTGFTTLFCPSCDCNDTSKQTDSSEIWFAVMSSDDWVNKLVDYSKRIFYSGLIRIIHKPNPSSLYCVTFAYDSRESLMDMFYNPIFRDVARGNIYRIFCVSAYRDSDNDIWNLENANIISYEDIII